MSAVATIRTAIDRPPHHVAGHEGRRAAVAAVFTGDAELLFIRRAQYDGDPWSGHVSFPGGRMEPTDDNLAHTAIRETHEEIGLDLSACLPLGELDEIATMGHLPSLVIRPFVFYVPHLPELRPNHEVASVHRLPLRDLLSGTGRGPMELTFLGGVRTMPRVDFDGVRLWGLTLMLVDDLLHRIDGGGVGLARTP
jgi:8-oxo-dGTP pyrophosphatase MutT (NUDIX family)